MAMSPAISCSKCMTIDCYKATHKPTRDSPRRSHWDTNIPLPIEVQQELTFWLKFLLALNQHGRNIFASNREPDLTIRGDGSKYGYGGTTKDSQGRQHVLIFDKWSDAELDCGATGPAACAAVHCCLRRSAILRRWRRRFRFRASTAALPLSPISSTLWRYCSDSTGGPNSPEAGTGRLRDRSGATGGPESPAGRGVCFTLAIRPFDSVCQRAPSS